MANLQELLYILKEPRSMVAESYRGIRASLQRALAHDVKTIMFVSSYGGDGKSMLCANVAVALTQLFLDVVLVDGDMRRPTLTNLFEVVDRPGLGEFLEGKASLDEVLTPTSIERLRIVSAGASLENPGDLLARPALASFCKQISEKADAVVIDTSPISACNDALSIGQHIDTTIMVVSPRQWDGDVEVRIRQTLEQHKVPLMGLVINGTTSGDAYGGSYGYGYGQATRSAYSTYGYYGDDYSGNGGPRKKKGFWARLKSLFGPE